MGGRNWSREELIDLGEMHISDFMTKWGRTQRAVLGKRQQYGLKSKDQPQPVTINPLCLYCSEHKGGCTCSEGHRCLDLLCAYAKTNRR